MKSKRKIKKPTFEEKKELHGNLKKVYEGKSVIISEIENGKKFQVEVEYGIVYDIKKIKEGVYHIQGNDKYFVEGKTGKLMGSVKDNLLIPDKICENAQLEIMLDEIIVRTGKIIKIKMRVKDEN